MQVSTCTLKNYEEAMWKFLLAHFFYISMLMLNVLWNVSYAISVYIVYKFI